MATNNNPEMSVIGGGEKDGLAKDVARTRTASGKACFACRQMKVSMISSSLSLFFKIPKLGSLAFR